MRTGAPGNLQSAEVARDHGSFELVGRDAVGRLGTSRDVVAGPRLNVVLGMEELSESVPRGASILKRVHHGAVVAPTPEGRRDWPCRKSGGTVEYQRSVGLTSSRHEQCRASWRTAWTIAVDLEQVASEQGGVFTSRDRAGGTGERRNAA